MWTKIDQKTPEGISFLTCINDEMGIRNEAVLTKQGNLWFLNNGTYVYYTPTHYYKL